MESRPKFKAAIREAKNRARAARAILGLSKVSPDEAAPPLWNGWQQVARAAALVITPSGDDVAAVLAQAAGPDGPLASIPRSALEALEWIEAAASGDDTTDPASIPNERWLKAADHLHEAIWSLVRWDRNSMGEIEARFSAELIKGGSKANLGVFVGTEDQLSIGASMAERQYQAAALEAACDFADKMNLQINF